MKDSLLNKKGVALITVVLFFLVLVTLLSGLLFATINNLENTQTAQRHTSVYYVAESGINLQVSRFIDTFEQARSENWTISKLENEIIALKNLINDTENTVLLKDNLGKNSYAEIIITGPHTDSEFPSYTFYSIQSTGHIDSIQRVLTANIGYDYVVGTGALLPITGAIVVNEGIYIQNGSVVGSIASNLEDASTIYFRNVNCASIPAFTVPVAGTSPCPAKEIVMAEDKPIVFSDIILPEYPTSTQLTNSYINIDSNPTSYLTNNTLTLPDPGVKKGYYISNINPTSNFTINLGSWMDEQEYLYLRVTNSFSFNNSITVTGTGKLMLLLDHNSSITINAPVNQNSLDPTKFMIILKANSTNPTITIANNNTVVASILSNSTANISWNQANFFGFLASNAGYDDYSGEVSISAGSAIGDSTKPPIWIYAPYANAVLQGNANFYGTVMANSFYMNSSKTTLTYKAMNTGYPFSEWTILPGVPSGEVAPTDLDYRITPIKEN